jgi:hypothetical protein
MAGIYESIDAPGAQRLMDVHDDASLDNANPIFGACRFTLSPSLTPHVR